MDWLDPLKYITPSQYDSLWNYILRVLLDGFWMRLFAVATFGTSLWVLIMRRNIAAASIFFVISVFITYIMGILKYFLWR